MLVLGAGCVVEVQAVEGVGKRGAVRREDRIVDEAAEDVIFYVGVDGAAIGDKAAVAAIRVKQIEPVAGDDGERAIGGRDGEILHTEFFAGYLLCGLGLEIQTPDLGVCVPATKVVKGVRQRAGGAGTGGEEGEEWNEEECTS